MDSWERRLRDLAHLLSRCAETYFDPELFRLNANQFIQTSRTVTFLIQKNKDRIPDFERWYQQAVLTPWASDAIMLWAKDSRNVIEKEGDLELNSTLRAAIIFSYIAEQDFVLPDSKEDLLGANVKRLLRFARKHLPTGVADAAVLKIERRWVANSLPHVELARAMTYIYARHHAVCDALARHVGRSLDGDVPDPTTFDPNSLDIGHVRYMKLSEPKLKQYRTKRIKIDPNFKPPSEMQALHEQIRKEEKPRTLQQTVALFARMAQVTFELHGNHVPMLFLFDDTWGQIDFLSAYFDDQADKYIFWRSAADRAAYLRAAGLIWISESWIRDWRAAGADIPIRKMPIIGERLNVVGADLGAMYEIAWDIRKDDAGVPRLFPSKSGEIDPATSYHLLPVLQAMKSVRAI